MAVWTGRVAPTSSTAEVDSLLGDGCKARAKLGWRHRRGFDTLVAEMVEVEMVDPGRAGAPQPSRLKLVGRFLSCG
jgi:hypothetical protein